MRGTFAALLAQLAFWVQYAGLERTVETKAERRDGVPAVFTGSARAVMVDLAWLHLGRAEDARAAELWLRVIAMLQPHNPDACVAASARVAYDRVREARDQDERWLWVRAAVEALHDGTRRMPEEPIVALALGRTLVEHATWREGHFDEEYVARVTADRAFQRRMAGDARARTPFELAMPWFARASQPPRARQGS